MPTHEQFYLTCTGCGELFIDEDGEQCAETEDEIRDLAEDNGWLCYQGGANTDDYCINCLE